MLKFYIFFEILKIKSINNYLKKYMLFNFIFFGLKYDNAYKLRKHVLLIAF